MSAANLFVTFGRKINNMSRIGKKPIIVPKGVKLAINNNSVTAEGPKGKSQLAVPAGFTVQVSEGKAIVKRPSDEKHDMIMHGTIRSLLNNMIIGVNEGYERKLEIVGTGYKALVQGKVLNLQLGFSHPVDYNIPDGVTIEAAKPTFISIKSVDKIKIGKVASEIRSYFKPEPYKGKGILYSGEFVRRKAGKAVA